ncbi:MAG: hypothetical protein P8Y71_06945 [Pseudolabrys sp.]
MAIASILCLRTIRHPLQPYNRIRPAPGAAIATRLCLFSIDSDWSREQYLDNYWLPPQQADGRHAHGRILETFGCTVAVADLRRL